MTIKYILKALGELAIVFCGLVLFNIALGYITDVHGTRLDFSDFTLLEGIILVTPLYLAGVFSRLIMKRKQD